AHILKARSAQLDGLARAGHCKPTRTAVERGPSAGSRSVPITIGLHHGAQLAAGLQLGKHARTVASYRRKIHARECPTRAHAGLQVLRDGGRFHACPAHDGARTGVCDGEPCRRAASRPASVCTYTPQAAASNASRPCASSAAIVPVSTSPVPAVARAGLPPVLIATRPPGSATSASSPLSTTTAPDCSAAARA